MIPKDLVMRRGLNLASHRATREAQGGIGEESVQGQELHWIIQLRTLCDPMKTDK